MLSSQISKSEEDSSAMTNTSTMSISSTLLQLHEKISQSQETLNQIDEVHNKSKSLQALKPTALDIDDLVALDRAHQHLSWLHVISNIIEKSKSNSKKPDYELVVKSHQLLSTIVTELIDSSCLNLRSYALQSLLYIRTNNLPNLEAELESDLEALNYPKCVLGLEEEDIVKNQDFSNVRKLQKTYSILSSLQLPEPIVKQFELTNIDPALEVLKPLKKRFKFHFMGKKKTNNPNKPEWYLQQVGTWMKNSKKFFDAIIIPIDHSGTSFERFATGLSSQVLNKLKKDIAPKIFDDVDLSHMIDEILNFSQEFHSFGVEEATLPLVVLLEPVIFQKWLSLERKFAFSKIDDMMLDDQAWTTSAGSRYDVSKCTETFVVLLQSITNRFKHLNEECQLKFVELQSDLLEDMRLRFAQVVRQEQTFPLTEKYCLILNSSYYLKEVMNGWSEIPLYLQLELAKYGEDHVTGLFKEVMDGFDFFVQELIKNLSDHIYYEVKSRSKLYKDIKWFSYSRIVETDPCAESLPMFQSLASQSDFVDKKLINTLSNQIISQVCEHLSDFYIHDIILLNHFSPQGCEQIQIDIEKGMDAIFSQHVMQNDPKLQDASLKLKDVIKVLNTKQAQAILIMESLNDEKQAENYKDILLDVGVTNLDGEQTLKILARRVDMK